MPKTPAPTQAVVQALQGHGRRSPLYWWMRVNYPTLKAAKGEDRADWKGLVVELTRLGLTDINNKPPTTEIARKTWARVVKDMATKPEPIPQPKPLPVPAPPTITIPKRTVDARPIPQEKLESESTPVTGNTILDDFWKVVDSR